MSFPRGGGFFSARKFVFSTRKNYLFREEKPFRLGSCVGSLLALRPPRPTTLGYPSWQTSNQPPDHPHHHPHRLPPRNKRHFILPSRPESCPSPLCSLHLTNLPAGSQITELRPFPFPPAETLSKKKQRNQTRRRQKKVTI